MRRLAPVLVAAGAIAATAFAANSETVTIVADPSITRWPYHVTVYGAVSPAGEGQEVTVQSKACGSRAFSRVAAVTAERNGSWFADTTIQGKTVFRAMTGGERSREVVVQARPHVVLGQVARRRFRAILELGTSASGKRLVLQRFDRDERVWRAVQTVVFRSSSGSQMTFPASVPRGTTLRLVLPRAQAQPCYLAGYSNVLAT